MTNALISKMDAAAARGGISLFAGGEGLSEEQKIEQFNSLLSGGERVAPTPQAPIVPAAPVTATQANEQPPASEPTQAEVPLTATPEVAAQPERMAVPSVDLGAIQQKLMATGMDEEQAKLIAAEVLGPIAQQAQSAAHEAEASRRDRLVQRFGSIYPELKKPGVLERVAPAGASDADVRANIALFYGDRKQEMRAQTQQQMTPPTRQVATTQPYSIDQINIAAIEHFKQTGDMAAAQRLKANLIAQARPS